MIDAILEGIWSVVQGMVNFLLGPIDAAISAVFPQVGSAIDSVSLGLRVLTIGADVASSWIPIPEELRLLYFGIVVAGFTIMAANAIPGVFKIIQKIKFW